MKTYIINLPERTDRRAFMEKQMKRIGFDYEFHPAMRVKEKGGHVTLGYAGVSKSVQMILNSFLTTTDRYVMILEDDALLCADFEPEFWKALHSMIKHRIHALWLGCIPFKPYARELDKNLYAAPWLTTQHAVVYSRHGADTVVRFLKSVDELGENTNIHFDNAIGKALSEINRKLMLDGKMPFSAVTKRTLAIQQMELPSSLRKTSTVTMADFFRFQYEPEKRLQEFLAKLQAPLSPASEPSPSPSIPQA